MIMSREEPGGGAEGNARLTGLTAVLLLVALTTQAATAVLLGATSILTFHVALGLFITPLTILKLASTGWRARQYYRGVRPYQEAGKPALRHRVLGPALAALTLLLLASGVLAFLGPAQLHATAKTLHAASFYLWLLAVTAHVVPHFVKALRLAGAEVGRRAGARVPGRAMRRAGVLCALGTGLGLTLALARHSGTYQHLYPHR